MNWFESITGFPEISYTQTQRRLRVVMGRLTSAASPRSIAVGSLETPSLGELRSRTARSSRSLVQVRVSLYRESAAQNVVLWTGSRP